MTAFFMTELTKIRLNDCNNYDNETIASAKEFEKDCQGAADGNMDITFQEMGRGYYAHLHELARLEGTDKAAYAAYREKLLQELATAEEDGSSTHQMKAVKAQLR